MYQRILFLCLMACAFSNAAWTQTADSVIKPPPARWARPQKIDVKHIALDLRFDWVQKRALGTASLTIALLDPGNKVAFDAGSLTIQSVSTSKGKPLAFTYDGSDKDDALEIALDRRYQAGEALTIKITYHSNWVNESDPNNLWGSYGKGLRFFGPTATDPKKRWQIWSVGDPESNRYWFPGCDAPNDLRTCEVTGTVDKGLMFVSNGRLLDTKTNTDGTRSFHWKMDLPHANSQTAFVVGAYADIPQRYKNIEIHNYGYPDEVEAVAASVVRLPDMIRFLSEATGVEYPFSSYAQVFVQDFAGGIGNATFSTITENMIDDYRTHADYFYLWDGPEAETLASQWFGNYLTCRDWGQVWLNKAFAHYFNGLYNEHKNGREEYLLWQHWFDQNTYLGDWNAGIRHPVVTQYYENAATFTADNYATGRGALVLHLLRKHLGEDKWKRAIRLYLQANAHKLVSTEDFRKAVEAASGDPMDWFFDQWLYKMGHPVFELTKTYDETKKQLLLTVKQTQKADPKGIYPQVEFFMGKVDIEIDEKIERVWLEPKAENTFVFAAAQAPKLVNFDYESSWIKEMTFQKSLDELLYQFQNDRDIFGKRWALGELVALAKNEQTPASDKAKIYAGFRNVILGKDYWRLRFTALQQLQGLLAPNTALPADLDEVTRSMLLAVIKRETSWNRAAAIAFLGTARDAQYADLYIQFLNDSSDRVINAAAIALGKSKSPKAFEPLIKLANKPSWKNQSLISTLYGLQALGDPRAYDLAYKALTDLHSPHWTLATPVWDYRITAAATLAALGKSEAACSFVLESFKKAMAENDLHGIFYNVLLLNTLANPKGLEVFDLLKAKFKDDANMMMTVEQYETQFKASLKPTN